jgi:hypothetical protein
MNKPKDAYKAHGLGKGIVIVFLGNIHVLVLSQRFTIVSG